MTKVVEKYVCMLEKIPFKFTCHQLKHNTYQRKLQVSHLSMGQIPVHCYRNWLDLPGKLWKGASKRRVMCRINLQDGPILRTTSSVSRLIIKSSVTRGWTTTKWQRLLCSTTWTECRNMETLCLHPLQYLTPLGVCTCFPLHHRCVGLDHGPHCSKNGL